MFIFLMYIIPILICLIMVRVDNVLRISKGKEPEQVDRYILTIFIPVINILICGIWIGYVIKDHVRFIKTDNLSKFIKPVVDWLEGK